MQAPRPKLKRLANGMRLITVPMSNTGTLSAALIVNTGSRSEAPRQAGLAHFLEHMMFKGTKKRPTTLDISRELEGAGAQFNAFTSNEFTGYYITAAAEHYKLSLDLLYDMITSSVFKTKELGREKRVVIEEIRMINDDPPRAVWHLLEETLYPNQPAGRPVIGTEATVASFSRPQLVNFWEKHYLSANSVVAIAGSRKRLVEIEKELRRVFKGFPQGKTCKISRASFRRNGPAIKIGYKKTDQAHLVLAVKAFGLSHPGRHTLEVLNSILGVGMSSRLFINIREREGLGYYISSSTQLASDTGYLAIRAGVDIKRLARALQLIKRELDLLKTQAVDAAELTKAKNLLRGHALIELEASLENALRYSLQVTLTGRCEELASQLRAWDGVTAQDVQRLANQLVLPRNMCLAIVGPFKSGSKFVKILE